MVPEGFPDKATVCYERVTLGLVCYARVTLRFDALELMLELRTRYTLATRVFVTLVCYERIVLGFSTRALRTRYTLLIVFLARFCRIVCAYLASYVTLLGDVHARYRRVGRFRWYQDGIRARNALRA